MHVLLVVIFLTFVQNASPSTQPVKPVDKKVSQNPHTPQGLSKERSEPSAFVSPAPEKSEQIRNPKRENQEQDADRTAYNIHVRSLPFPPPDPWFRWYVGITALTGVIGLFTLFFIWKQSGVLKDQLAIMEDGRKQQEDLIRLEHRAWMKLEKIHHTIERGRQLSLTVVFQNIGRTPARDLKAWMFLETVWEGKKPSFNLSSDKNVPASPVVPPDSPLAFPLYGEVVTNAMAASISIGQLLVMFHGKIAYKDIFGCQHWMTFCQQFDPDVQKFMIYPEHNETD
jgi:hypothetical protein